MKIQGNLQGRFDHPRKLSRAEARLIVDTVKYFWTFFTAPDCFDWDRAPLWAAVQFGAANAHRYARRRSPLPDVGALAERLRPLTREGYMAIVRTVDQDYVGDVITGARWPLKSHVEDAVAMLAGAMTV